MAYIDEGHGDPIVMVHGNPTWSFYWRQLIGLGRTTHRCIAPDHIGHGRSDKPSRSDYPYTLERRIDDLEALLEHLDVERVTLVVHDWGGAIGMGWATRHPDRVARLVVTNTAAFHLPSGKRFPAALRLARVPGLGALLVRGAHAFVRGANRTCVTRAPMPSAVATAYLAPYPTWADRVSIHRFVQDIPLHPGDPSYATIDTIANALPRLADKPMMLMWGMNDFIFDHHFLAEWERRFPVAEVHRFSDCGHYLMEDAGVEVSDTILEFIAATPTVTAPASV